MTSWVRPALWALAVVAAAGAAALTGVAIWVDLDTADRVASVCGAILAGMGLVVSVAALNRPAQGDTSHISVGRDGTAIFGDVNGSATGRDSKVVGPPSPARPSARPRTSAIRLRVSKGGSFLGGDVSNSATASGSERRES
ncbi:hypothetical protein [Streptomyces sp. NPDC005322]|uniref:hypothetical protein n=1 Tax=Streptomyces sp. NPDC005322 TaxID=3157032 RepID=UPI0033AF5A69